MYTIRFVETSTLTQGDINNYTDELAALVVHYRETRNTTIPARALTKLGRDNGIRHRKVTRDGRTGLVIRPTKEEAERHARRKFVPEWLEPVEATVEVFAEIG